MKKEIQEIQETPMPKGAYRKHLKETKIDTIFILDKVNRPSDWLTIQELAVAYPRYTIGSAMLMRSTSPRFPRPVAVATSHMGGLAFLYKKEDYRVFCQYNGDSAGERSIAKARRLEAEAARIRYRLKQQGFQITIKGGKK